MDRRGPARIILALFVALVSMLGPATATSAGVEPPPTSAEPTPTTQPDVEPTDDPEADRPVPTVSDFYPEDNNLSDCLGLVERPGCGSESRGGWRQTAVFVILALGMALIFWRISVGVRRNRVDPPAGDGSTGDGSADDGSAGDGSAGDRSPDTDESRT